MEEIIGLLVVLAIGIFKAVGKKLENAGNQPAKTFEPIEENPIPEPQAFDSHRRTVEPTPVAPKPVMPKPAAPKKPILQEEEQEGPKEKIDPKKLVLYSEIMKQKFNE